MQDETASKQNYNYDMGNKAENVKAPPLRPKDTKADMNFNLYQRYEIHDTSNDQWPVAMYKNGIKRIIL